MRQSKARNTSPKPACPGVPSSDIQEERIVSTVYLAGEAIAEVTPEPAEHAMPQDDRDAPFFDDFGFLKETITVLRRAIAADPQVAEFLRELPQGLGNGEILQVLFGNLFPEQREQYKVYRAQKRILTETQSEVLRDTARGLTPTQVAEKRGCSTANVHKILDSTQKRLNTGSPQAAVAVAISMGYLPLDVLDFVFGAGKVGYRDYSALDSMISRLGGVENVADPIYWQELSAFGLTLMLVSGAACGQLTFAAEVWPTNGALYRLKRQWNGAYQAQQIVGPGWLRLPRGIAVAPHTARRQGFTPGNVFVVHNRATFSGRNIQEIVEFTSEGQFERAFCGGRGNKTSLHGGTYGIAFARDGALLATSGSALLRFTEGGSRVQCLVDGCCTDVCTDKQGNLYVAHYSSAGGCLRSYSPQGKLLRELAPQPSESNFFGVQVTGSGQVVALREQAQKSTLEVYSADGEHLQCWELEDDSWGSFALDAQTNLLFVPIRRAQEVQVFSLEGKARLGIKFDAPFTPSAVTLASDGSLWVSGLLTNASSQ